MCIAWRMYLYCELYSMYFIDISYTYYVINCIKQLISGVISYGFPPPSTR